jgi:hypothetical protein
MALALVLAATTVPCGFAVADQGTQTVADHRAPQAVKPSAPRSPAIIAGSASMTTDQPCTSTSCSARSTA